MNRLTLWLLVANLPDAKWCKIAEKWLKTWQMGTHMRVFSESYPMNINWQHDRVKMVFKNLCVLLLKTKVASAS